MQRNLIGLFGDRTESDSVNLFDDADVIKCLKMLTFLSLDEIKEMEKWEGSELNQAKDILAYELTKLVHGEEEAIKSRDASKALFASGNAANMPECELTDEDFNDGQIGILSVMVKAGLASSNKDARRNVEQGGVNLDGEAVTDVKMTLTKEQLSGEGVVIKRGKKKFVKVIVK